MMNRATSAKVAPLDDLGDWSAGPGPLFRQLARAIASGIERGALAGGAKLPAERSLATMLSVGRGTAVAAYDLLVADGLVERRHGSGTYVVGNGDLALPAGREGTALVHRLVDRSSAASSLDVIDLSISVVAEPAGFGRASLAATDLAALVPDTGYSPWGLPALRAALAAHVSGWGLPTTDDQIVVTTGAQQAISAAAACWVRPGDTVVVDDPTYPGAVAAFAAAGARLVGVPVDRHGLRVGELEEAIRSSRPALVYLQTTVHSPTGSILGEHRRRRIAELVAEARVPTVEDLALADLAWSETRVPPPMASFAPGAAIAVVGSLSKLFWGGLRIGWVRAPSAVALRFARVKATQDLGSSAVSQVLATQLLAGGGADRAIAERRRQLRLRHDRLVTALGRELPSWSWSEPAGGLSLWLRLANGVRASAFAPIALRHGVAVATADALSPSPERWPDRLRISFSSPPAQLEEGVHRLARAWAAIASGP
jgi:DNA-binding transcriptional MocR family regulator